MSVVEQIKGWRDKAFRQTGRHHSEQTLNQWQAEYQAFDRVLALLDGAAEVIEEKDVLAETGASVYVRGSRAYAELGGGMIRLDTMEGLQDGELLCVLVLRRESDA